MKRAISLSPCLLISYQIANKSLIPILLTGQHHRLSHTRDLLAELVDDGRLIPVEVEGWSKTAYLHPDAKVPRRIPIGAAVGMAVEVSFRPMSDEVTLPYFKPRG